MISKKEQRRYRTGLMLCNHNYIAIDKDKTSMLKKCTKCGKKVREDREN